MSDASTKQQKTKLNILNQEKWEDENYLIEAGVIKTDRTEGVAVRTSKKYLNKAPIRRKSLFIQKDQKITEILNWLYITIKNFFSSHWDKEIITKEELKQAQSSVTNLTKQLKEEEKKYETLQNKFNTQEQELQLAYKVINNISIYKITLEKFESKIQESEKNNTHIEEWVKNEIKKNRWILGLDCEVKAKNQNIDIDTEIDLHIVTNYGEQRIIEVKSPNLPIFEAKKAQGRTNITTTVKTGLSELIEYMRRTDINSGLRKRGDYDIQKPIGRLLIGYKLNSEEQEVLNDWNFYLAPYLKIITFKELITSAKKEIALINSANEKLKIMSLKNSSYEN